MKRENFKTDEQFKRYLDVKAYWYKLIAIQEGGDDIYMNGDLVKGKFFVDSNTIGIRENSCIFSYVGDTHEENKKTGEYDLLFVPYTSHRLKILFQFKTISKFEMIE